MAMPNGGDQLKSAIDGGSHSSRPVTALSRTTTEAVSESMFSCPCAASRRHSSASRNARPNSPRPYASASSLRRKCQKGPGDRSRVTVGSSASKLRGTVANAAELGERVHPPQPPPHDGLVVAVRQPEGQHLAPRDTRSNAPSGPPRATCRARSAERRASGSPSRSAMASACSDSGPASGSHR